MKVEIVQVAHCTLCGFKILVFTEAITFRFTRLSIIDDSINKYKGVRYNKVYVYELTNDINKIIR